MKVLLRADIKGVGRRGDIVQVKSGFARNFLLPRGSAVIASDATESQSAAMRKARDLRDQASRAAAEVQKNELEKATIVVAARAGANDRLFGSVTEADIVNAIRTATSISLDRQAIVMTEHLKELGKAQVKVNLFDGVIAGIEVEVVAK
jgi:large subunit ribosomal protein L9